MMQSVSTDNLSAHSIIAGERAVHTDALPQAWQDLAAKSDKTIPESYINMARLFLAKMQTGDVELFDRAQTPVSRAAFGQLFGTLAYEALAFYGSDYAPTAYPDFAAQIQQYENTDRQAFAYIARDLFAEFGTAMPASFYWLILDHASRETLGQPVYLKYDQNYVTTARAFDASLHAQKVFPIQMRIQSIASQYGFTFVHGCQCGCDTMVQEQPFEYQIPEAKRAEALRAFTWIMWYEYAIYPITPGSKYLLTA